MNKELLHRSSLVDQQAPVSEYKNLIADPLGDGISSVELVRVSGTDLDIVNAARVSYGKVSTQLSDRDIQLIRYLIEHDHTSTLEHNQLSFRVKAPLFVSRQWMRHRMSSFNEISYRYVASALEFYTPRVWREQDTKNRQGSIGGAINDQHSALYQTALDHVSTVYQTLLEAGVCREQARGVLPLCTYTEFIYTCNLHSFLHFIKLRTHAGAQYEIRVYAYAMLAMVRKFFPIALDVFIQKHELELQESQASERAV
jgi:thymidylate synthase (FAD)